MLPRCQTEMVSGSGFLSFVNSAGREGWHRFVLIQKHLASVGLSIFRSNKKKTLPKDLLKSLKTTLHILLCGTEDLVKLHEELPKESESFCGVAQR